MKYFTIQAAMLAIRTLLIGVCFCGVAPLQAIADQADASFQHTLAKTVKISAPFMIQEPSGGNTRVFDINSHGDVVGMYGPLQPYNQITARLFRGSAVEGGRVMSRSFKWSRQRGFRDIGEFIATSINDCGDLAGALTAQTPIHAFRMINGRIQDLGTLEPNNPNAWSIGRSINNRGEVVGVASDRHLVSGFRWSPATGMVKMDEGEGFESNPYFINDRGQIVGAWNPNPMSSFSSTTLWDRGLPPRPLGVLGGRYGTALAINLRGEIVGLSATDAGSDSTAFYWSSSTGMIELAPRTQQQIYIFTANEAFDIDDQGRIVGTVNLTTTSDANIYRAALWISPEKYFLLSDQDSNAVGINRKGEVIGHLHSIDNNQFMIRGAIWKVHTQNGAPMHELNTKNEIASSGCRRER